MDEQTLREAPSTAYSAAKELLQDPFSPLRNALHTLLENAQTPAGEELTEFQNAASVLAIADLMRAYDRAAAELARLTQAGPLGPLSPEEVRIITVRRSLPKHKQWMMLTAAEATAKVYTAPAETPCADVGELWPKY